MQALSLGVGRRFYGEIEGTATMVVAIAIFKQLCTMLQADCLHFWHQVIFFHTKSSGYKQSKNLVIVAIVCTIGTVTYSCTNTTI